MTSTVIPPGYPALPPMFPITIVCPRCSAVRVYQMYAFEVPENPVVTCRCNNCNPDGGAYDVNTPALP